MFKVNNRNIKTRRKIYSKLTIKTTRITPLASFWFLYIVGTSLYKGGGGLSFRHFEKKGGGEGGSDFSHKKGGIGNRGCFLKKGVGSLIFMLTNPFQCYLSLSVWCVCVLFIYTISIRIICVSQEEPSLIVSNQQIYDFYK